MRYLLSSVAELPSNIIEQINYFIQDGNSVNITMALVDLLPNIIFMLGMAFIIKSAFGRIKPIYFALLSGGALLAFLAGTIKAMWKVLCAVGYNCIPLTSSFGIYQFIGMTMIAIASLALTIADRRLLNKQDSTVILSASALPILIMGLATVTAKLSAMWVILLVLPTAVYQISFALMAWRRKMTWQGILFIVSLFLATIMGALKKKFEDPSSQLSQLNWLAQCVNIIAQVAMVIPAYLLCRTMPRIKVTYDK